MVSMIGEPPKEKFLRLYPGGFSDPTYLRQERNYKLNAHEKWLELLNREEFDRLLDEEQYDEICRRALQVEAQTKFMLAAFEKVALRDAVKGVRAATLASAGLFELVYGEGDFQTRFEEFVLDLGSLPGNKRLWSNGRSQPSFPMLQCPSCIFS